MTDTPVLLAARWFPGGGGPDDTAAARSWARQTLDRYGLSAAWPVAAALITAGRTGAAWWMSLRADRGVVAMQILRASAAAPARLPCLPDPIPGLADGVRHTYGAAHLPPAELCMWASVTLGPAGPPT
ncbi:hypothetical protein [Streptomyces sp. NPDC049881]|uniref:hypothetical protein n=1 Tax=Streptomyces sp. NPDC049881 TaxID=3155778 RepID=UPI00341FEB22